MGLIVRKADNSSKQNKDEVFFIYFDQLTKEIVTSYSDDLKQLCGRKGFSIAQITPFDIPIPKYFIITSNIFDIIFAETMTHVSKMTNKELLAMDDVKFTIPDEVVVNILKYYSRISGFSDAWVAIRPSIVLPDYANNVNFSGVIDTLLNVRGEDDVISAIHKVYEAFWSKGVRQFLINHNVKLKDVKLAIVVQKMVQSESAGVAFSVNPINKDDREVMIECVFGLGDVIANGLLTPDQYTVEKSSLNILEKLIAPQEWMMVRDIPNKKSLGKEKKVDISDVWQRKQKMDDPFIKDVSDITIMLEKGLKEEIEIEYCYSSGQLWILQVKESINYTIDDVDEETVKIDQDILQDLGDKLQSDRERSRKEVKVANQKFDLNDKIPILTTSTTNGIVSQVKGRAIVIDSVLMDKIDAIVEEMVCKDFVIITDRLDNRLIKLLPYTVAIVSDEGGIGSDLAIESTAANIPILTNTYVATWKIRNGELIIVDSEKGCIYSDNIESILTSTSSMLHKNFNEKVSIDNNSKFNKQKISSSALSQLEVQEKQLEVHKKSAIGQKNLISQIWVDEGKSMNNPSCVKDVGIYGVSSISLKDIVKKIGLNGVGLKYIAEKEYADKFVNTILSILRFASPKPCCVSLDFPKNIAFYKKLCPEYVFPSNFDYFNDIVFPFLKILRRVNTVFKLRNLWISIENLRTNSEFNEIKKYVSMAGFRRSTMFNVGINICYPSIIYELDKIIAGGIDFVVVDIETLSTHLYASLDAVNANVVTDSIVSGVVSEVVDRLSASRLPLYIQTHNKDYDSIKKIIKTYLPTGVSGFIISDTFLNLYSDKVNLLISQLESDMILQKKL